MSAPPTNRPTDPSRPDPAQPDDQHRRPLSPDELRARLGSIVYYASRCQNPGCLISTVPSAGEPDRSTFPNYPKMDTARCHACGKGFIKQFKLVGSAQVDAFQEQTAKNARAQKDAQKAAEAAAYRSREPAATTKARRALAKGGAL